MFDNERKNLNAEFRQSVIRNVEIGGFLMMLCMVLVTLVAMVITAIYRDQAGMVISAAGFVSGCLALFLQYLAAQLFLEADYANGKEYTAWAVILTRLVWGFAILAGICGLWAVLRLVAVGSV